MVSENEEGMGMGKEGGMGEDEVGLIKGSWFVEDYWYLY